MGRRGTLRKYCTDECSKTAIRCSKAKRKQLYAALKAAGAAPSLAQWGSQGAANFEAMLSVLAEDNGESAV